MKSIKVELPDRLAHELNAMVKAGWFSNEAEAMRSALRDFVRRNRPELLERFQCEDIAWALNQKIRRLRSVVCDTSVILHLGRP